MPLPEETKLCVDKLKKTLGSFKDKYEDVNKFLDTLGQSVAENDEGLVDNVCIQFVECLDVRPPEGCCKPDVDAMKNAVQEFLEFLFPREESEKRNINKTAGPSREELSEKRNMSKTAGPSREDFSGRSNMSKTAGPSREELPGRSNMSKTAGPSSAGQKSQKLNVAEGSLSKTTYAPAGKASLQSSGDTPTTSMDKGKDGMHKSTINVAKDENPSAGGQQNQNQDSVLLDQRTTELDERIKERDHFYKKNAELCNKIERLQSELKQKQDIIDKFEHQHNEMYAQMTNSEQEMEEKLKDQEKAFKAEREQTQKRITHYEDQIRETERKHKGREKQLVAERDDLRNRYSKLAGQALKDNNSDISDLSDPNRPMKLGEKFSELYDNEWTDIFQAQMDTLKRSEKESIQVLLSALQECYTFCKQLADKQMDMLRNGFLYHCQDASKPIPSGKDKPRLHSKEEKSLLEVRKMIGANNSGPVKQAFLAHMAGKSDTSGGKAAKEFTAYYEKCTEICWLMALNDPPLYMDMEFKQGAKMDGNLYTPYYTPGDKVDFLVWPPLFNVQKGGLINKGVMAPIQEKRKIKK